MSCIREATYLTLLGRVPLLSVKDADCAYVVFVELFNQPVPPKDVAIIMGGGGEVEPLCDESTVTDYWKQSIPNSSCHVEWRVAHKTTAFPCSSLNRDGTFFSTWGLIIASKPENNTYRETRLTFSSGGMGPNPTLPFVKITAGGKNICNT